MEGPVVIGTGKEPEVASPAETSKTPEDKAKVHKKTEASTAQVPEKIEKPESQPAPQTPLPEKEIQTETEPKRPDPAQIRPTRRILRERR